MNKFAAVAVLAVVIMAAVMPGVSGYVAEKVTNRIVARVNANNEKLGELSVASYQRGYRSSQFSFEWIPGEPRTGDVRQAVLFNCAGRHGVLSYSYQCKVQDLQSYSDFVIREFAGFDPLTVDGEVSVFGSVTQRLSLQAFESEPERGSAKSFAVYPGTLTIETDSALSEFVINGKFAGLKAEGKDGIFLMGNMTVAGELRINQYDLAIGDLSLTLESARLGAIQQDEISLKGLTLITRSEEQGENINIAYQLGMSDFVHGQDLPASEGLRNLLMDFQLDGIAMQKLAILNKKLLALRAQADSANNAYLLAMLPDLEALLKPGLALKTRFSAEYLSQPMMAELDLALLGKLSFADYLLLRVSPGNVFAKIDVSLNTQVPQLLLENHPQAKAAIVDSAWYSKTTEGYASKFRMANAEASLNGEQISVDELLKLMTRSSR